MQAALLGLPQAWSLVLGRAETGPSEGLRFPGFAPPVQDSEPSADHFANMMQALQWMLLQPGDDAAASVRLVRLWPRAFAVSLTAAPPSDHCLPFVALFTSRQVQARRARQHDRRAGLRWQRRTQAAGCPTCRPQLIPHLRKLRCWPGRSDGGPSTPRREIRRRRYCGFRAHAQPQPLGPRSTRAEEAS